MRGSRKQMGLKKDQKLAACFSLLLVTMLLHLQISIYISPCCVHASSENIHKSSSFKAAPTSYNKIKGGLLGKVDGEDEIFGSDKRKVNTGPNPLHNR